MASRLMAWAVCIPLAGIGLAGCGAPVDAVNLTTSENGVTIVRDIPYGPGPLAADPQRALDVYRPSQFAGPLPVVVFFYGGAWQTGARDDYLFVAARLARQGVIVAVPDYRKYPQVQYPAFLQDAAQAVAFVQRASPSWGGDPHRVFVMGHSAGAYIAAMLALDPEWLRATGIDRQEIAGTVGLSGPYDFLPITGKDIQAVFAPADADLPATQPVNYVDGRNRPMLLITGLADSTVRPANTEALAARIRAAGGPVQVDTYPGVGHVGTISAYAGNFGSSAPTMGDVLRFVDDPANAAP